MPIFSRSERYLILAILILGLIYAEISYFNKRFSNAGAGTINVKNPSLPININTAAAAQFERLPGIGAVLAEDIILYRQKVGGFKDIEGLKSIKGIGDRKFEHMKEFVTITDK